jgi:sarcosine oxidase
VPRRSGGAFPNSAFATTRSATSSATRDSCVRAQLALARHLGAEIHTGETALEFAASAAEVTVTTERATYAADTLIVAAGAWLPQLVAPGLACHFTVRRQVLFWFDVEPAISRFVPGRFPVFIWELQGRKQGIYGFPAIDGATGGLKIGTEQYETTTTPETIDRNVSDDEMRVMYDEYVAPQIPALGAKCVRAVTCLYTMTPDYGFVIDRHPDFERVIIAAPCSGHGFKHSPAIGEALAQLAIDGESAFDLGACKFARFG